MWCDDGWAAAGAVKKASRDGGARHDEDTGSGAVGAYLVRGVLAADQGTPKMIEIATAIQELDGGAGLVVGIGAVALLALSI